MANHPTPAYLGRQLGEQYSQLQDAIHNTLTEDTIHHLTEQLTQQLHTTISKQDTLNLLTLHILTQPILHTLYPQGSGNLRDPNQWGVEHENPRYVVDLLEKLVTVAIKTRLLLDHAPSLDPLPRILDWPTEWDTVE